jgi:hypothetical protein
MIDVSGYEDGSWTEPVKGSPDAPIYIPETGLVLDFKPGPEAHALESTIWLSDGEDLTIEVSIAAAKDDKRASDLRAVAFIDGIQQHVGPAQEDLFAVLKAPPGKMATHKLVIAAEDIADGAHSLNVVLMNATIGFTIDGMAFTVLKNDVEFPKRPDHTSRAQLSDREPFGPYAWSGRIGLQVLQSATFTQDGKLQLHLILQTNEAQSCADRKVPVMVMALLDQEKQVDLAGFGPFVRVEVDADHAAVVDLEVGGLPQDGERHSLTLIQVQGDGLYSEAPVGTPTPWYRFFLNEFGTAYWGSD